LEQFNRLAGLTAAVAVSAEKVQKFREAKKALQTLTNFSKSTMFKYNIQSNLKPYNQITVA